MYMVFNYEWCCIKCINYNIDLDYNNCLLLVIYLEIILVNKGIIGKLVYC